MLPALALRHPGLCAASPRAQAPPPAAETRRGQCGADLSAVDAVIEPGEADRLWVELVPVHLLPLPQALLVVRKVVPERPRLELPTAGVAQGPGLAGGVGDELDAEGFDEGARVGGQRRIARIVAGLGELVVLASWPSQTRGWGEL
eukprot:COSAG04_NODE_2768_length_3613_cov_10.557769_5_plen_146_part_00